MEHVHCSTCGEDIEARPPRRAFWGLIVSFWAFSLLFGIGAAISGWSVVLLLAWVVMASTVGLVTQRVTSWSCPECGSPVPPPAHAVTRNRLAPQAG